MGLLNSQHGYGEPAGFLAITRQNTWAHSAARVEELADTISGEPKSPLEFFDDTGQPQLATFDGDGRLIQLEPTGQADSDEVLRRLEAVITFVVAFLRERGEPLDDVPQFFSGQGLRARMRDVHFTRSGPHDPGGFFHNALHRAGRDHD
jgi:hypothetical protein